jgi:hypothetical protein
MYRGFDVREHGIREPAARAGASREQMTQQAADAHVAAPANCFATAADCALRATPH